MAANLLKSLILMFIHFFSSELIFRAFYLHHDVFMCPIDLTVTSTKTRARKALSITFAVRRLRTIVFYVPFLKKNEFYISLSLLQSALS